MKRLIAILTAIAVFASVMLFSACESDAPSVSLYQRGLNLIPYMKQTALYPEAFFSSATEEYKEPLAALAGEDHTTPKAVYEVTLQKEMLFTQLSITLPNDVPEQYEAYMIARAYESVPSWINAKAGLNAMAISSVCATRKTFVSNDMTDNTVYIYTFDNATPVMVVFTRGDDNSVTANCHFLLYDEFRAESAEAIEESLSLFGAEATPITA